MIIKNNEILPRDIDLSKLMILNNVVSYKIGNYALSDDDFSLLEVIESTQKEIICKSSDFSFSIKKAIYNGILELFINYFIQKPIIKIPNDNTVRPLTPCEMMYVAQIIKDERTKRK